jgi:methionine synthase / methylenetetrahydrofolate reductase(NADPH)
MKLTKTAFAERLRNGVLLSDGGMGTMLYAKGIYLQTCFDGLNIVQPEIIRDVHREYIAAGAELIETNTFGANRFKLKKHGLSDKVAVINAAAAAIARREAGEDVLVAGAVGPLGLKIEPWGPTSTEEAGEAFTEQIEALAGGGVDLIILETFADINEIRQALKAAAQAAPNHPVIALMTIGEDGNSLYGTTPEVFGVKLAEWGADAVGVNCSVGPAVMLTCIERLVRVTGQTPLCAMPNAGVPREVDGRNIYLCSPDYLGEYTKLFIQNGVRIVGGCCGTTPAHTRAMKRAVRALQPPQPASSAVREGLENGWETPVVPRSEKSNMGRMLEEGRFIVSLEIIPPRGYDCIQALESVRKLRDRGIAFVNIPDGPRASARMSSLALAALIRRESEIEPVLHYTCRDRNLLGIQSDLIGLHALGVKNILAVTGDPPKLGDYPDATAVFDVDSIGLTNVLSALNSGRDIGGRRLDRPTAFLIGVGANPAAVDLGYELSRFEWKVKAGAEFAITQPVFDVRVLKDFLEKIRHCRIPVLAGIWPLSSLRNAEFMHNEVPGVSVPDEVMERMRKAQDKGPEEARKEGLAIAQEILNAVKNLVQGVQISPASGRTDIALEILKVL